MIFDGYFAKVRVIRSFQNRVKVVPWHTNSILIIYLYLYLSVCYGAFCGVFRILDGFHTLKMVYGISLLVLPALAGLVQKACRTTWGIIAGKGYLKKLTCTY